MKFKKVDDFEFTKVPSEKIIKSNERMKDRMKNYKVKKYAEIGVEDGELDTGIPNEVVHHIQRALNEMPNYQPTPILIDPITHDINIGLMTKNDDGQLTKPLIIEIKKNRF